MTKKGKILAGVMAWPVSHSLSPTLHGYWIEKYGINGSYLPLAVPPKLFQQTLKNLPNTIFIGVNVNYHAKFGGPCLKNDSVMTKLDALIWTDQLINRPTNRQTYLVYPIVMVIYYLT